MSRSQKTATRFLVDDNSGAKIVEFVGMPGNSRIRRGFKVADKIKVTVKKALPAGTVKPGQMYDAVITRTKKWIIRKDGSKAKSDANAVVLLNKKGDAMLGTRVLAPVCREVASLNQQIGSSAPGVF